MRIFHHLFLRILPFGLIAGFIALMVIPGGTVSSERIEAINLTSGPGAGYNSGTFGSISSSQKNAGAEFVRETIDWSRVETTAGTYDWNSWRPLDAIFTSEKEDGFKIVAVLDGAPSYLANTTSTEDSSELLVAWANFVQAAVNQFGDRVDVWEIGSRVNSNTGMSPFLVPSSPNSVSTPNIQVYGQLVKVAAKIISNSDPNDELWMGSLVSAFSSSCAVNPLTFLLEMNATKAWSSIDSVEYRPERGAVSPETTLTAVNSACASSLPAGATTLAGELTSVTDLARQLGGKTVRIEGLGWSDEELTSLGSGRSISTDQLAADYLTRASVIAFSGGKVTSIFWRGDASTTSSVTTALANINSVLDGAEYIGQFQGQTGSVYEYRFQKGNKWIIIAWRAMDGDAPIPVTLAGLETGTLTAYAVDAPTFTSANGITIDVDGSGNAIVMLNERPVVFVGYTSDISAAAKEEVNNQITLWKHDIKLMINQGMNDVKAAMMQALENMFNSAKEKAIQWGEDKLNELLN
jgi:hypothetical protein